jgi:YD repeat-containing protein
MTEVECAMMIGRRRYGRVALYLGFAALTIATWTSLGQMPAQAASVAYTYDLLGRVTTALYDNGTCIIYSYDAAGNRTSQTNTTGGAPVTATWGTGTWGCFKWTSGSAELNNPRKDLPPRDYAETTLLRALALKSPQILPKADGRPLASNAHPMEPAQ